MFILVKSHVRQTLERVSVCVNMCVSVCVCVCVCVEGVFNYTILSCLMNLSESQSLIGWALPKNPAWSVRAWWQQVQIGNDFLSISISLFPLFSPLHCASVTLSASSSSSSSSLSSSSFPFHPPSPLAAGLMVCDGVLMSVLGVWDCPPAAVWFYSTHPLI